jgi:hypothetical protein
MMTGGDLAQLQAELGLSDIGSKLVSDTTKAKTKREASASLH